MSMSNEKGTSMHSSSYCGVNCEKCGVYIAAVTSDEHLKEKMAKEWGALYKRAFKTEDISCEGCKSGIVFTLCARCDIKTCNESRDIDNCGECAVFPCDRIQRFFDFHKTHDTGSVFE